MLWGIALVQPYNKRCPTIGTASPPMQTALSAPALIVRFTYFQVASILRTLTTYAVYIGLAEQYEASTMPTSDIRTS